MFLTSCQEHNNPLRPSNIAPQVKVESKYWMDKDDSNNSYIVYRKEFDISGNLIEYSEFWQNGDISVRSQFTYNNFESYEKKHIFSESGELSSIDNYIYIFKPNGRLKEKKQIDSDGNVSSKEVYDYDVNGNVSKKIYYNHLTGLSNSIDYSYKYSSDGRIIERITIEDGFDSRRDSIVSRRNDNQLEVFNYDAQGNITLIKTFYYNQFGLLTIELGSNPSGLIFRKYAYRYEFF